MTPMTRFLSACALGLAMIPAAVSTAAADEVITVTGQGQVFAAPDMATIRLGVTETDAEAARAMDATSQAMGTILARLTELGIAPRDVQTQSLQLDPIWQNRNGQSDQPPRITGYRASNQVMVRVRDLSELGGVLDALLQDGANDFGGLSFGIADPDDQMDAARRAAVADAMAKARLYAEAAGVTLGDVVSMSETGSARPQPRMMEAARVADAMPIAGGELGLSASVTMVFAID
ncbi:MAG: SIMPL domain-containing protein [Marinibacterium sp.]|nr:SIMPL domain-containing protein [Marinibacterium sp.]